MAKHSVARKRRSGAGKTRIKRNLGHNGSFQSKYRKPQFTMEAVKDKWNPERSARQNLASMGLAANPNEAVGGGKVGARADAAHEVAKAAAIAAEVDANELFEIPESDDLRSVDANSRRRKQPMMEKDAKYIEKLVGKHGDDYAAMARDIKLNVRQLTAKNLEKMAARWKLL